MSSFFAELKRRNVVRVGFAYVIVGWIVMQVIDVVVEPLRLPEWTAALVLILLLVGLPISLILSWAFELTPDGVKTTEEVDADPSAGASTGQKLNYLIVGALVLAVGFLFFDRQTGGSPTPHANDAMPAGVSEIARSAQMPSASIAVLPFADLSPTGNREYFADGLSEEILNVLVKVDDLTVASRTSSFQFKGRDIGVPDIAKELNVTYVLEGSVRTSGDNIRVTGQLIEASSDRHIWSDSFDQALTAENIFSIQDEIAKAIVVALGEELGFSSDAQRVNALGGTQNFSAYDTFLRGRELFLGRSAASHVAESMSILEAAVDTDPDFARAWLWLGAAYSVANGWGVSDNRDLKALAISATDEALRLDDSLAFAYAIRANARTEFPPVDWPIAMAELERASTLEPKNATTQLWLGLSLRKLGYLQRASRHIERCLQIDPAYENCKRHQTTSQVILGDHEGALGSLWSWSNISFVRSVDLEYALLFARLDNPLAARMVFESSVPDHFGFPIEAWINALRIQNSADADLRRQIRDWLASAKLDGAIEGFLLLSVGAYGDLLSPTVSAETLDDIWIPEFSQFRKTDVFRTFVRSQGLVAYWQDNGFPDQCRPVGIDNFECD